MPWSSLGFSAVERLIVAACSVQRHARLRDIIQHSVMRSQELWSECSVGLPFRATAANMRRLRPQAPGSRPQNPATLPLYPR